MILSCYGFCFLSLRVDKVPAGMLCTAHFLFLFLLIIQTQGGCGQKTVIRQRICILNTIEKDRKFPVETVEQVNAEVQTSRQKRN